MNAVLAPPRGLLRCPTCRSLLAGPWRVGGEEEKVRCERCASELSVSTFPALHHGAPLEVRPGERAQEGEATCFFHAEKRAERACDRCGRFLCALCDLPFGARHLCPSCLSQGAGGEPGAELVNRRTSWSQVALLAALLPIIPIFWGFWPITAPLSVVLALFSFAKPGSLVEGRRPWTAGLALLIGLAQLTALGLGVFALWKGATHRAF